MAIVVLILIFGGIAYYEWRRLVHDMHLRGAARLAATLAIAASIAPMLIANLVHRGGPPRVAGLLAWPAFLGWALFALVFVGLVVSDVVRGLAWIGRRVGRARPMDPSRRQALARITGGAVTALA